jgi:hypothetical protein
MSDACGLSVEADKIAPDYSRRLRLPCLADGGVMGHHASRALGTVIFSLLSALQALWSHP